MLHVLVGYLRGAGVDARWVVIDGDAEFFAITKRLHNRIHGVPGDTGTLGRRRGGALRRVTGANAEACSSGCGRATWCSCTIPRPRAWRRSWPSAAPASSGVRHIGADTVNAWTDEAWAFLRPYLPACAAYVFTRRAYVPAWLDDATVPVIPPSIDPFSPKNQELSTDPVPASWPTSACFGAARRGRRWPSPARRHPGRASSAGHRSWPRAALAAGRAPSWSRCRAGTS